MVNFLTVRIDDKRCDYCLECTTVCPSGALTFDKCFEHNPNECMNCEVCMDVCPNDAIRIMVEQ
jgi:ferredoxin